MDSTYYIGIDQSLTGTGLCVIDENCKVVATNLIGTKKMTGVPRLNHICNNIQNFISSVGGNLRITREEYSFSSKGRAVFDLGALGGCVDLTVYRLMAAANIKSYHKLPATVHKKYCLLDGSIVKGTTKADKAKFLALVQERTGESFDDDNIADSYMLARTMRAMLIIGKDESVRSSMCQAQVESLVAHSYVKDNGLTPSKIRQMTKEQYASAVSGGMRQSYTVFECETGSV